MLFMVRDSLNLDALPCNQAHVLDRNPALFSLHTVNTMPLFMWQHDIVGWHTSIMNHLLMFLVPCLMLLMMRLPHIHQPWRLDSLTHPDNSSRIALTSCRRRCQ